MRVPVARAIRVENGDAVFEGKKLTYQNKWSLGTRSWSEAQSNKKTLEKRLKDLAPALRRGYNA
jgi:hypothetical protein